MLAYFIIPKNICYHQYLLLLLFTLSHIILCGLCQQPKDELWVIKYHCHFIEENASGPSTAGEDCCKFMFKINYLTFIISPEPLQPYYCDTSGRLGSKNTLVRPRSALPLTSFVESNYYKYQIFTTNTNNYKYKC